jgi:type IV pilus assembly protein PilM
MLTFVKNWFGPKPSPIGVDLGSDSIKMAQCSFANNEWKLTAAATADVPPAVRHDTASRMNYVTQALKELLAQGNFAGREAVLGLPSSCMFLQHLRVPKMDDEAMKKALPWEAQGKLPIDPLNALLRHHVAGEVYQDQEAKSEVILMAAGREIVNQFLAAAARAKLDIVGMNVEPKAIIDCFGHVYRRKGDAEAVSMYVDIGASGTRAVIAQGGHMLFARNIHVGGDQFTRVVASAMNVNVDEARLLRLKCAAMQPAAEAARPAPAPAPERRAPLAETGTPASDSFAILGAALAAAEKQEKQQSQPPAPAAPAAAAPPAAVPPEEAKSVAVRNALRDPLNKLIDELDLCRRYYEATFTDRPVDRVIFIGGEAKNRLLCQDVARGLGLAAQVGDPLARMGRISDIRPESGIDRRHQQPNWAVAIGLSMGPLDGAAAGGGPVEASGEPARNRTGVGAAAQASAASTN